MTEDTSRSLELRLVKGPLSPEDLQAVAALYGAVDGKYGSVSHCEQLFHRSPFGPTLHAFAMDGKTSVGHYCLIPYDLVVNGKAVRAAKGEALCIDPSYRRTTIGDQPSSDAMMNGALVLAAQEGLEVVYAVAGAPGVVRLFERCGHRHEPFIVRDLIVPPCRALPLQNRARLEWMRQVSTRECRGLKLREVDFEAVQRHFPLEIAPPSGHWQAQLSSRTLEWFGPAPSNRYFQLGEALVWLTETHSDWELIASFTAQASCCERQRLALELRDEASRRQIDRIRIPQVVGVEPAVLEAFRPLSRREVEREISWIIKSEKPLGAPSPHAFLWSHF